MAQKLKHLPSTCRVSCPRSAQTVPLNPYIIQYSFVFFCPHLHCQLFHLNKLSFIVHKYSEIPLLLFPYNEVINISSTVKTIFKNKQNYKQINEMYMVHA